MTPIQENYIIVKDILTLEIEEILKELANLYSNTGFIDSMQLYRKKGDDTSFLVCCTNQPTRF